MFMLLTMIMVVAAFVIVVDPDHDDHGEVERHRDPEGDGRRGREHRAHLRDRGHPDRPGGDRPRRRRGHRGDDPARPGSRRQIEVLTGIDTLPASVYQFSTLPSEVNPVQVAVVAGIAMVLSLGATLLPSRQVSGILDGDVERLLQLLVDSGFSIWQVLPLGDPQGGLSPYQCTSAFAMNPHLLPDHPAFNEKSSGFKKFCDKQQFWLDDYAIFKILKRHFNDAPWNEWPDQWKFRDPQPMQEMHQQYEQAIAELKWQQYQLHKRWQEIRDTAADMGILLFGDMPIFIAYDSADVWAHAELFLLDANDNMTVVTGVPPDYFSETGQRWGNPHYDWEVMQEDDYAWWKARIRHLLDQFDIVRIDHFRGLEAAWMIDASCETAVDGEWLEMPGEALFTSIQGDHSQLPFVAEDLGLITPEVTALRKKYHLPGMSILQFGFDEFDDNPHKPKNITEDTVVYTGTHDNDTTKGWFNNLEDHVKKYVVQKLKSSDYAVGIENPGPGHSAADNSGARGSDAEGPDVDQPDIDQSGISDATTADAADFVVEKMIDNAMYSRANICIIPLQDCMHLGTEARMNVPGTTTENWQWQFQWQQLEQLYDIDQIRKMRLRNEKAHRLAGTNQ